LPRLSLNYSRNVTVRSDVLINLGTFLARRWSENPRTAIVIVDGKVPFTNIGKSIISIPPLNYYAGTEFQKYRQWRVSLWYESMRLAYSAKVLSYDLAFGHILNTMESKRVEYLGLKEWKGMENEVIFNEGISLLSRPLLNSLYGKQKIVEAFSQSLLTGYMKGELFGGELERVNNAVSFSNEIIGEALENKLGTDWIEQHVPQIIKLLQINPLITIPLLAPKSRLGLAITQAELIRQIERITKRENRDQNREVINSIVNGTQLVKEYETLVRESKRSEIKGYASLDELGLSVPDGLGVDERIIYDNDLITKLKAAVRNWKIGWIEIHDEKGDEIDTDALLELHAKPFFTDNKISIKTKITLLLDHSSSIEDEEIEYKKTTIALCETLKFLGITFAVYAFSTKERKVKCWVIKRPEEKWSPINARNLVQIKASGGTPLAEIYNMLFPIMRAFKPDLMITLTDGEPSDYDAVRSIVSIYKMIGIHMVAIGLAKDIGSAVNIGHNLKGLDFERILALSRLQDIPRKVLSLLQI
jgi:hypothetical protein